MRWVGPIVNVFFISAINPGSASPTIRLKKHSDEYDAPVGIAIIKEDPSRLFVVERGGLIKIVSKSGGKTNATPFLDASSLLGKCTGYCAERGLLGLAFHPNYMTNGRFFINYTQEDNKVLSTIVSQFNVDESEPDIAKPNSETIILKFAQPYSNQ